MKSLREVVTEYKAQGIALGHFNISDSNQIKAVAQASQATNLPVFIGLSEGEREHFPLQHARALVTLYQAAGVQVYLSADHTYSAQKAKEAIDAGVDAVVVDGAKLSMEENMRMVKEVVSYARSQKRDVLVEGELGYIGSSSKVLEGLPEGVTEANLTTAEDAAVFARTTELDLFAPAVGNVHGMLKDAKEPRLHPERVKAIAEASTLPLVLHGASGNTEADIVACVKAGVVIVHINTELRLIYRDRLYDFIRSNQGEVAPYKFIAPAVEAMQRYVTGKLRAFAGQSAASAPILPQR